MNTDERGSAHFGQRKNGAVYRCASGGTYDAPHIRQWNAVDAPDVASMTRQGANRTGWCTSVWCATVCGAVCRDGTGGVATVSLLV
jgi:hypothetical protein